MRANRFDPSPLDSELLGQCSSLKLSLHRTPEGGLSAEFELRGYAGTGELAEFTGLPEVDDPMDFARRLLAKFKMSGRPPEAMM